MSLEQIKASLAIENLNLTDDDLKLLQDFEQGKLTMRELVLVLLENQKERKVA